MRSSLQKKKTEAILANMERGLLLYIDRTYQTTQMNVPDVYAMRLCQTRVSYFVVKSFFVLLFVYSFGSR